jgi:hypothetical protein
MDNPNRKAIVLVVDRLSPTQIGAYGNTCHATDSIDEIASQSILFDQAFSPCADLESTYRSLFSFPTAAGKPWLQSFNSTEIETHFVSDRDWLAESDSVQHFEAARCVCVKPLDRLASRVSQTWLARYFAQALTTIESMPRQGLTWLDCSGLARQWDAPYQLREQLADPDDPEPPQFHDVPGFLFDAQKGDPDILLGVQQAVDAQVNMIDSFVGVLFEILKQPEFSSTLFCLMSLRGLPMGQHGIVGEPNAISRDEFSGIRFGYNESLQVPMLVSLPNSIGDFQAIRSGKMISPAAIPSLVEPFLLGDDLKVKTWVQDHTSLPANETAATVLRFENESGIQTHAWKFLQTDDENHCELYAKPDDLWEVNDVSKRCPTEVRLLRELLETALSSPQTLTDDGWAIDNDSPASGNAHLEIPSELITRHD